MQSNKEGTWEETPVFQKASAVSCTVSLNLLYITYVFVTSTHENCFPQESRNRFMQFGQEKVLTGRPEGRLQEREENTIGDMSFLHRGW